MSQPPKSGTPSLAVHAAAPVRVYVGGKGRRCGMVVGMAVGFAVALFLWAGFMVYGLSFMIYQALRPRGEYSYFSYMSPWRIAAEWCWPSLSLLASVSLGLWLIAAARAYRRFVRLAGECAELAQMHVANRRETRSKPMQESSHGNHV